MTRKEVEEIVDLKLLKVSKNLGKIIDRNDESEDKHLSIEFRFAIVQKREALLDIRGAILATVAQSNPPQSHQSVSPASPHEPQCPPDESSLP